MHSFSMWMNNLVIPAINSIKRIGQILKYRLVLTLFQHMHRENAKSCRTSFSYFCHFKIPTSQLERMTDKKHKLLGTPHFIPLFNISKPKKIISFPGRAYRL